MMMVLVMVLVTHEETCLCVVVVHTITRTCFVPTTTNEWYINPVSPTSVCVPESIMTFVYELLLIIILFDVTHIHSPMLHI